jgi:predicted RNase H-like HicB family nuclease
MNDGARYIKIVEWSGEDEAFVGQCPGITGPWCHGTDEVVVFQELCQIVEEWILIAQREGRPLPPPTAGKNVAQLIG